MRRTLAMAAILFLTAACSVGPPTAAPVSPSAPTTGSGAVVVSIDAPAPGAIVPVGVPVTVSVSAADPLAVNRIDLAVNGLVAGTFTTPDPAGQTSLTAQLLWTPAVAGGHVLAVTAFRPDGTSSQPVVIAVSAVAGTAVASLDLPSAAPTSPSPMAPPSMATSAPPTQPPSAPRTPRPGRATATPRPVTQPPTQPTDAPTDAPTAAPTETAIPEPTQDSWAVTASSKRGQNSQTFQIQCAPNGTPRAIWGTYVYTDDSSICTAAAHVGLITVAAGGLVTYKPSAGQDVYVGSLMNGIQSRDYGSWPGALDLIVPDP